MDSSNTYNCTISGECDVGYVGSNCEAVDLDCHNNGVPSDGVSGDKNTRVCTNGLEPFCDDMTTVDSGHQDPTITFTYGNIVDKSESINVGQDTVYYSSSYANYSVKGKITIPQNGDYRFRISSQNDVKFTISGTSISIGSIDYDNQFQCQEDRMRTYETTNTVTLTKGDYNFEIKGLSGCAIEDQYFSLEWIFYRYYISSGKTAVYTTVPRRYLKAA
ncbi:hypothetical protein TVAG_280050 [Trichomonas vaginalis G3]|uniref:PA14 domain-containing protein n=1 Tax=Trichomonas vaginalis (strain ATCC PRA-98 / G3) TaxID=412133 RepID=A2FBL8_TRIV3|nr:hypothetical protein TVAGG3_0809070 [Trichomonas vaginalis G3]EAX97704.1 hypothetical protein TVAG_280050 [Trichomonas vaginalis G3]KAI5497065.1 hypothetical protein TVAGG3_0809070 [Trichomonas vaginalis G3]|eukprot:XP_001310634.1 hypothetical protein [Trichomonas vaginalis G3]